MQQAVRLTSAVVALAALSACETPTSPRPVERGEVPAPTVEAALPSQASQELRLYYNTIQQSLLIQDLLRTDGGGPDTPFNKRQLVNNFVEIAAFDEFTLRGGSYVQGRTPSRVQRWTKPVKVSLTFGDSVPTKQAVKDRGRVGKYLQRLSGITGHPIASTRGAANFHVAVLDTDDIAKLPDLLPTWVPGISSGTARQISDMPRDIYCTVYIFMTPDNRDQIETAVAIVRAEHPDLLRLSCFHEEIAQGLGLANDSPDARPSIFNDNDEFALLTRHDELLLKMLYDPRLPIGATPATARPVAEVIAAELLGGES